MPYSTPEKRALRDRQRRQKTLVNKTFCCPKCKYVFESIFNLKRHEKRCTFGPSVCETEAMIENVHTVELLPKDCQVDQIIAEAIEGQKFETLDSVNVFHEPPQSIEPVPVQPECQIPSNVEEALPVVQVDSVPHTKQGSIALSQNQVGSIPHSNRAASTPRTPSVPLVSRTNPPLSSTPKHSMPPGNRAVYTPPSVRVPARVSINCKPSMTSLPSIKNSSIQNSNCLPRLDDDEILKEEDLDLKSLYCTDVPLPDNPAPYDFELTSSQLEV